MVILNKGTIKTYTHKPYNPQFQQHNILELQPYFFHLKPIYEIYARIVQREAYLVWQRLPLVLDYRLFLAQEAISRYENITMNQTLKLLQ